MCSEDGADCDTSLQSRGQHADSRLQDPRLQPGQGPHPGKESSQGPAALSHGLMNTRMGRSMVIQKGIDPSGQCDGVLDCPRTGLIFHEEGTDPS